MQINDLATAEEVLRLDHKMIRLNKGRLPPVAIALIAEHLRRYEALLNKK
jgi:hypothetical protein